jgi:hypothetical protein
MLLDGPCGIEHILAENDPQNPAEFEEPHQNLLEFSQPPTNLNEVNCDFEPIHLIEGFAEMLEVRLREDSDIRLGNSSMAACCLVWERALQICVELDDELSRIF